MITFCPQMRNSAQDCL